MKTWYILFCSQFDKDGKSMNDRYSTTIAYTLKEAQTKAILAYESEWCKVVDDKCEVEGKWLWQQL